MAGGKARSAGDARAINRIGATRGRPQGDAGVPGLRSGDGVPLAEVVSALSFALDITEGQPEGHSVRTCLVGMRIAEVMGLSQEDQSALFYALLLKDLGCSSNASRVAQLFAADDQRMKQDLKVVDWTRRWAAFRYVVRNTAPHASPVTRWAQIAKVALGAGESGAREMFELRCERGSEIARTLGFPEETATAIRALDEHWDGKGQPLGLAGAEIPLLARIAGLSQTVAVFHDAYGAEDACRMVRERRGTWFDPELADALISLENDLPFWASLSREDLQDRVLAAEPAECVIPTTDEWLDRLAAGFAEVVDAKSPWTARHSANVASLAVAIGLEMGLVQSELRDLRRAALLHDIGKLGISNRIWDKPSFLTDGERAEVRRHPTYTRRILARVTSFRGIADLAGSHHERLDGRGYDRGLRASELSTAARILTISDVFDALASKRPYREGLAIEDAVRTIRGDVYLGICPRAFEGLTAAIDSGWTRPED